MLEGYALEVALTAANSAAQAWYGYDQVCLGFRGDSSCCIWTRLTVL